jgi:hypothetical protein
MVFCTRGTPMVDGLKRLILAAGILCLSACGGGSSDGGGDLSCDIKAGGTHLCVASTGYGMHPGDADGTKANCTAAGGTLGTSCDLTGAVAGCKGMGAGGGSYITFTYWYYDRTAAEVQALCDAGGQTLVSP